MEIQKVEYPENRITGEDCVQSDRAVIESKRELAKVLEDVTLPFVWADICMGWSKVLLAEARSSEIALHNNLWLAGQQLKANEAAAAKNIVIPSMVPGNGRRQ